MLSNSSSVNHKLLSISKPRLPCLENGEVPKSPSQARPAVCDAQISPAGTEAPASDSEVSLSTLGPPPLDPDDVCFTQSWRFCPKSVAQPKICQLPRPQEI